MEVSVALEVLLLLAASMWPCTNNMYGKCPVSENASLEGLLLMLASHLGILLSAKSDLSIC